MGNFKIVAVLLSVLLIVDVTLGVVNKSDSEKKNKEEEKTDGGGGDGGEGMKKVGEQVLDQEGNASDRISTLSNEYGPPRLSFNGPAPVYGPPELSINQIRHSNPSEDILSSLQPPQPLSSSIISVNNLRSYGSPLSQPILPQLIPPKSSAFNFRPPKIPPWKLSQTSFNSIKSYKGPPIPISLEAYGPPRKPALPPFAPASASHHEFRPPPPGGSHSGGPRPGVPAPPTPPDIKYDGWQPIAGPAIELPNSFELPLANNNVDFSKQTEFYNSGNNFNQHEQNIHIPSAPDNNNNINNINDNYRLPPNDGPAVPAGILDHAIPTRIPSNSYGEPINNPEDHSLKQSVKQGGDAGLPPPQLPESEPLHNIQEPAKNIIGLSNSNSNSFSNNINDITHDFGDNNFSLLSQLLPPNGNNINGDAFHAEDLSLQHLSINNPPPTLTSNKELIDSYLVPPPSSFLSGGPYPAPQRPSHFQRNYRYFPRNNGPIRASPHTVFPSYSLPTNFIPPRNLGSFKFHDISGSSSSSLGIFKNTFEPPFAGSFKPFNSLTLNQHSNINCPLNNNRIESSVGFNQPEINTDGYSGNEQLELELNVPLGQSNIVGSKDSYGNPIGLDLTLNDQKSAGSISSVSSIDINNNSNDYDNNNVNINQNNVDNKIEQSSNTLTGAISSSDTGSVRESYSQSKSLTSTSVDLDQLTRLHNGDSEPALALAQALSAEGASADGFQIHGSKGTYSLQIQSADDIQGTENTDGSIRHDQLLSNGLLQDILAAIEQPNDGANIQIQTGPQVQSLEQIYQQQSVQTQSNSKDENQSVDEPYTSATNGKEQVAIFFNNHSNNQNQNDQQQSASSSSYNDDEDNSKLSQSKSCS